MPNYVAPAQVFVNGALITGYMDVVCKQGADFNITLQLCNADGSNYDLTAQTANVNAVCRTSFYSGNTLNVFAVYSGNAAEGNLNVGFLAANTSNLQPINYVYEINLSGGAGNFRLCEGIMYVTPSVYAGGSYNF